MKKKHHYRVTLRAASFLAALGAVSVLGDQVQAAESPELAAVSLDIISSAPVQPEHFELRTADRAAADKAASVAVVPALAADQAETTPRLVSENQSGQDADGQSSPDLPAAAGQSAVHAAAVPASQTAESTAESEAAAPDLTEETANRMSATIEKSLPLPADQDPPQVRILGDSQVAPGETAVYRLELDNSTLGQAKSPADLLAALQAMQGKGILFGHQHGIDEAISGYDANGYRSDVYGMTGRYPAVVGFDVAEWPVASYKTMSENAKSLANRIVNADELGAIVTFSAHWKHPATGGESSDTTPFAVSRLLDGGDLNGKLLGWLDMIAEMAQSAVRADGTKIPLIFRPYHEVTGNWFWWGSTVLSSEEYISLWRYTVDYLRQTKGVDNLLFNYAPNGYFNGEREGYLTWYPGDAYVDIMGYDAYLFSYAENPAVWAQDVVRDLAMVTRLADERGKVAAYAEFGMNGERVMQPTGNRHLTFFTELSKAILADAEASKIAYMLTWANFGGSGSDYQIYAPYPGHELASDFVSFTNQDRILMTRSAASDVTVTLEISQQDTSGQLLALKRQSVVIPKGKTSAAFTIDTADQPLGQRYTVRIVSVDGAEAAVSQQAVTTVLADAGSPVWREDFSAYPLGQTYDFWDTFGPWLVENTGEGQVGTVRRQGETVLELRPKTALSPDKTYVAQVIGVETGADFTFGGTISITEQLRQNTAPNEWESGQIRWHYRDGNHYYYLALTPTGWRLGKRDAAVSGSEQVFATGINPLQLGEQQQFRIQQKGAAIQVFLNGSLLVSVTDQQPLSPGKIALMTHDAVLRADQLYVRRGTALNHKASLSLKGTASAGQELTASLTDRDGLPAEGIVYSWYADGVKLAAASGTSYTLTSAEAGKSLQVRAAFRDQAGHAEEVSASVQVQPLSSASAASKPAATSALQAMISGAPVAFGSGTAGPAAPKPVVTLIAGGPQLPAFLQKPAEGNAAGHVLPDNPILIKELPPVLAWLFED